MITFRELQSSLCLLFEICHATRGKVFYIAVVFLDFICVLWAKSTSDKITKMLHSIDRDEDP